MKSRKKFLCLDCGIDTGKTGEHYMLIDATWSLTGLGKFGMLCIEDVEMRIDRQLTAADFNDSYLNRPRTGIMSAKLLDRMSTVSEAKIPKQRKPGEQGGGGKIEQTENRLKSTDRGGNPYKGKAGDKKKPKK
jgi:hypothetical protein